MKGTSRDPADRQALALINRINRAANRARRAGSPHPTDPADGVWDCENYAGLKLARLLDAGYPYPMRGFHVRTSRGELHAVLEVTLPSGQAVVLDNLTPWALPREQTGHTGWTPAYIQRQAA
jgi:predicted transglutaminase-like cysteine proteinase